MSKKLRTSAGSPARTLELLWRQPPLVDGGRGRRPGLTLGGVVDAAIELADREGIDELTMRRLASAFDLTPMSLYTYVPGKAELLDLMVDFLYLGMQRSPSESQHWRSRLSAVADDNQRLYEAHAWMTSVIKTRPPIGPGLAAKYEYELATLEGVGLDDIEMDAALAFVLSFVEGCARSAEAMRTVQRETDETDADWWEDYGRILSEVFDEDEYPLASRVGTAAGQAHQGSMNADYAYHFGLQRVLDGLEELIKSRIR